MCPPSPEEPADYSVESHVQHLKLRSAEPYSVYLGCVIHMSWVMWFCHCVDSSHSLHVVLLGELEAQRNPLNIIDPNRMA